MQIKIENSIYEVHITRKKIKNITLRINRAGDISMSLPFRARESDAQAFLEAKASWIKKHVDKIATQKQPEELPLESAKELITKAFDEIYPCMSDVAPLPNLRVRKMKSRWGSCSIKSRTITINAALASLPQNCLDYVILHELAHFAHPNHSARFYALVTLKMPDWKSASAALKSYSLK